MRAMGIFEQRLGSDGLHPFYACCRAQAAYRCGARANGSIADSPPSTASACPFT